MSLDDKLAQRVARYMVPEVASLSPETSLDEAARTIIANHVSGMPVVDASGSVVGVISLTDILTAVVNPAEEAEADETTFYDPVKLDKLVASLLESAGRPNRAVADAMSRRIVTVSQEASVRDAARLLAKHRIHRVLVVDDVGQLAGILTAMDVVDLVAES